MATSYLNNREPVQVEGKSTAHGVHRNAMQQYGISFELLGCYLVTVPKPYYLGVKLMRPCVYIDPAPQVLRMNSLTFLKEFLMGTLHNFIARS